MNDAEKREGLTRFERVRSEQPRSSVWRARGVPMLALDQLLPALFAPPSSESSLVELKHGAWFGGAEIHTDAGHLTVREGELVQLFDLIAAHFAMEGSYPLEQHLGFWEEDLYGPDPRVADPGFSESLGEP